MKTLTISILALLLASCGGEQQPENVTIVDNGGKPCQNVNCVKHPADKDAR